MSLNHVSQKLIHLDCSVTSQIFWFGDLNYRLNMLDAEVRKLVANKQWDELINYDQVS